MLRANADWKVQIVGHSDSTGGSEYNIGLSDGRAEALRPCGCRLWTLEPNHGAYGRKAAARVNLKPTMVPMRAVPSTVA